MREAKSTDQEEAEELSFVPSAISVPQKLMFRCDNPVQRTNPQLLAVGVGEDSTQCDNKILVAKGDKPLTKWKWYAVME